MGSLRTANFKHNRAIDFANKAAAAKAAPAASPSKKKPA